MKAFKISRSHAPTAKNQNGAPKVQSSDTNICSLAINGEILNGAK